MVSMYYRGAVGARVVYDIHERTSFMNVEEWVNELRKAESDVVCMLIGNKCDLESERVVSTEEGRNLANRLGMSFAEVSALSGNNVR